MQHIIGREKISQKKVVNRMFLHASNLVVGVSNSVFLFIF